MEKLDHQHRAILEEFSRQSKGWDQDVPEMLSALADRLPLHKQQLVLDVAAGSGLVSMALCAYVEKVVSVDMTEEMMAQGKIMFQRHGITNVDFVKGYAEALPFAEASFDVVITRYSFHHFLDPQVSLREMVRVCRPGGLVVVMDLISSPKLNVAQEYNRLEKLRDPSHTRAVTFEELKGFYQDYSLEIQDHWQQTHEMDLLDWMNFSQTTQETQADIQNRLLKEINDQSSQSGFSPFMRDQRIKFLHQIGTVVGIKQS